MSKSIKIASVQGGPFNAQQNLIDFIIPEGNYDLSKSYVNIMSQCIVEGGDADAIYNCRLDYQVAGVSQNLAPPPIALVKNCNFKCQSVGELENIRRVDILRSNLKPLTQTVEEYNSDLYKTSGQTFTRSQASYSPWRELHGEGSIQSSNLVAPVQIPLSDLFNLGSSVVGSKLGEMRMHLELQDRFRVVQTPKSTEALGDVAFQLFYDVEEATQSTITTLTTLQKFTRMQDCPYWVGMDLTVTSTGGGGVADINTTAIITNITHIRTGNNKNRVQLTFNKTLGPVLTPGQSQTSIKVVAVDVTSVAFQMDYSELILQQVENSDMNKSDDLEYSTYLLEETNGNGLLDFNQQFWVEGSAYNLLAMPIDSDNDLLAGTSAGAVVSSRWTVNGVDVTDRDLKLDSPAYYDRLKMTLINNKENVKSLVLSVPNGKVLKTVVDRWTTEGLYGLIFQPVPITNDKKSCNLHLTTAGGTNKLMLYKHVAKMMKL